MPDRYLCTESGWELRTESAQALRAESAMCYPSAAENTAVCLASHSRCLSRDRIRSASKGILPRGLLFDSGLAAVVERTVESAAEAARVGRTRPREGTS